MFNLNDYEMVEERLKKWWKDNPDGAIDTDLVVDKDNYCVFIARLYRTHADQRPTATGFARTIYDTNRQTREFGMELAETSAIGRALANYIYSGKKRASMEEMSKVSTTFIDRAEAITGKKIAVEKPSDPWTIEQKEMPLPVSEAVTALNDGIVPEEIPMCRHGKPMTLKEGVGKTNKPYHGYVCNSHIESGDAQCPPVWYELDKSGRWVPQRPKTQQGVL